MSGNVPAIRFAGFTEPWEQRKLGELCEVKDSARVPNSLWGESGIPYIRASDLSNNNMEGVLFLSLGTFDFYSNLTGNPVKGDVLFNGGGEIGKAHLLTEKSQVYVQGGAVLYARTSDSKSLDGQFLEVAFESNEARSYIEVAAAGGTMKHFTLGPARMLPLCVPSMPEQQAIGTLFSHLKKSLLEKMFPKPGSDVPELRFAGFTEPWEQRKLREFGSVEMCKRIYKEQTSEHGEVPFFKIGTFGGVPDAFISRTLFEEYRALYPYPKLGALLISAAGSIGRIVKYAGEEAYYQDSNIVWLEHNELLDDEFLAAVFDRHDWTALEGSTIKRLYNKDLLDFKLLVPTVSEQRQIGSFFSCLDDLITLHQRKHDQLATLKKSLLEKMFV